MVYFYESMNILKKIAPLRYFLGTCLIYCLLYFPFLDQIPSIAMDEGWNAFTSASFFGLLPHPEFEISKTVFSQYNLFFLYYACIFPFLKLFGISLFSIRLFSTLCGILGLFGLYKINRLLNWPRYAELLVYLLYITSNISLVLFHWGRPEGMVTTAYIFFIYFFLKGYITDSKKAWFLTGSFSMIMLITHPFSGLILFPMGAFMLNKIIKKQLTPFTYFMLGVLPFFLLITINLFIINVHNIQNTVFNILDRTSVATNKGFFERAFAFLNHYTLGIKRLYIFLFEIGILIYGVIRKKHSKPAKLLSFFGLSAWVIGLYLFSPFRRRYFCIIAITSIIVLGELLAKRPFRKIQDNLWLWGLTGIFFLNTLAGDLYYGYKHIRNTSYKTIMKKLRALPIPKSASIVVPVQFWMPFHDYYAISNVHDFPIKQFDSIQEMLNAGVIDYVLVSPYLLENKSPTTGQTTSFYPTGNPYLIALMNYSKTAAELAFTIDAPPYGTLEIYKSKKKTP